MSVKNYQSFSEYTGSLYGVPQYNNAEYDFETADSQLIGSPGGLSTIHHHYTKGFDGRGNTSSDIYAGQGQRYNSGEYGNLYASGHTAAQAQGYYSSAPDYQFWQNQEPQQYTQSQGNFITQDPYTAQKEAPLGMTLQTNGAEQDTSGYHLGPYSGRLQKKGQIENFESDPDFELLDGSDVQPPTPQQQSPQSSMGGTSINSDVAALKSALTQPIEVPTIAPWLLFLFFLMAFIAFDFWAESGRLFVQQRLHGGKDLSWKQMLLYAVIVTLVFTFVIWMAGVPLTTFESF